MTQQTKWIASAIALSSALAFANSVQAQAVTGDPTLDNIVPTAVFDGWTSGLTHITSTAAGLQISAFSGGSAYFYVPPSQQQTLNPSDNQVSLTFTINSPAGAQANTWIGTPFQITDNAETGTFYGGYIGMYAGPSGIYDSTGTGGSATWGGPNGQTVTETVPLDAAQLAAVQTGNDVVSGFNLLFYPAVGANTYNVTYDSLVFSSSVPEPSTLGLIGTGVAGLLALRRRMK